MNKDKIINALTEISRISGVGDSEAGKVNSTWDKLCRKCGRSLISGEEYRGICYDYDQL